MDSLWIPCQPSGMWNPFDDGSMEKEEADQQLLFTVVFLTLALVGVIAWGHLPFWIKVVAALCAIGWTALHADDLLTGKRRSP